MAKLIINMDDNRLERIEHETESYLDYQILLAKLNNATVLSNNCTNGDIIKAMFNIEIVDDFTYSYGVKLNDSNYIQFNKDWWNAPYNGEIENGEINI